jgi:hypothetical protein
MVSLSCPLLVVNFLPLLAVSTFDINVLVLSPLQSMPETEILVDVGPHAAFIVSHVMPMSTTVVAAPAAPAANIPATARIVEKIIPFFIALKNKRLKNK